MLELTEPSCVQNLHQVFCLTPETVSKKRIHKSASMVMATLVTLDGRDVLIPCARISRSRPISLFPLITIAWRLPLPCVRVTVAPPVFEHAHFSSLHCGSDPSTSASE